MRNLIMPGDAGRNGVYLEGSSNTLIQGNFIGTDVTGIVALTNTSTNRGAGVYVSNSLSYCSFDITFRSNLVSRGGQQLSAAACARPTHAVLALDQLELRDRDRRDEHSALTQ